MNTKKINLADSSNFLAFHTHRGSAHTAFMLTISSQRPPCMSEGSSPVVYPSSFLTLIYSLEFPPPPPCRPRKKNPICWKEIFVANMTTVELLLHNSCESKHQWLKSTGAQRNGVKPLISTHCVHIIHRHHSGPCSHLCYSCSFSMFH